jgi:hypothetical protein
MNVSILQSLKSAMADSGTQPGALRLFLPSTGSVAASIFVRMIYLPVDWPKGGFVTGNRARSMSLSF